MNNLKRPFRIVLWLMLACVTPFAYAQSSGTLAGTVKDPSGAILPQATVNARNNSTGVVTTRATNEAGSYALQLPAGEYRVEATAAGFQSVVHERVIVDALSDVSLDLSLSVGSTNTEITVSAGTDTIQTDNTTLGATLRNEVYAALPLQMSQGVPRDPTSFISLAPGVAAVVLQSAGPSYTSFNGGQQEVNGLYFEGLPISFPNQHGDTRPISLAVSVDAVNQFQVEINGEKAEYQGQGFHNYVLKQGGNQFHGGVFEFFRNTALDSKGFFSNITDLSGRTIYYLPPDHQNEYGGNISGPIKKNKAFFFGNFDGYNFNTTSSPQTLSVPDLKARAGDFSELLSLATPVLIYDPLTQTCTGTVCTKQAFPGNIIPASRLAALHVGPSFQSYLPNPTGTGFTNNYSTPLKRAITDKNVTARVDYNINQKHALYGVFAYGKWSTDYTGNLTPTGTALPLPYTSSPGIVTERPLIAQLHETYTISPSLLNDIGVGAVRLSIPITQITQGGNYPQKAGLTGLPGAGEAAKAFPAINFSGANAPANWGSTGPFNEWENDVMGQDSVTWVRGNHIFKFGGTYQSTQDNRANPADGTSATFNFTNNATAPFKAGTSTLDTTQGNAYASFLLGAVDSSTIVNNTVVETGSRFHNYSLFAQDDWRLRPNLTLNIGVRWDVWAPFGEEHDRYSFAVPSVANPAAGGIGGALVYGQQLVTTHYKNFQPRFGFSYQADEKTVFRGGFVLANTPGTLGIGGNGPNGPGQTGFNPPSLVSAVTTGQPAYFWDQGAVLPTTPFPIGTPGFGAGNSTVNPTGAIAPPILWNPNLSGRSPYYMNWSFGMQRELPGQFIFGLTYSASAARFLSRYTAVGPYSNSMDPKYLALGSLLNSPANAANIAAAQAKFPEVHLPFANFQGNISTMLLPFPQYAIPGTAGTGSGGTTCYSCDEASSSYNSMQATLQHAFSRGFTAQISYTWAKEIDDLSGTASQLGAVGGGTRNPYDHKLDRGQGPSDHRHNLHVTWVYNLPAGKGHLLDGGRYVNALISGWQWSGIYSWETGAPLGVTGTGCVVPGIVSVCMVDINPTYTGNARKDVASKLARNSVYLDSAAFKTPANYTFGNEPRSAPFGLYVPTYYEIDSTVRRTFPIHDRLNFQLAADFFNLVNNTILGAPATNINSSTFGTITTQQNQPRHIQFSGRITF